MSDYVKIKTGINSSKLRADGVSAAVRKILDQTGRNIQTDMQRATSTWDNPPAFIVKVTPTMVTVNYNANSIAGKKFKYVNYGTEMHYIFPHRNYMQFMWDGKGRYRSKSRPYDLRAYSGKAASKMMVRAQKVIHPGTQARRFDIMVAERHIPKMIREIRKATKIELQRAIVESISTPNINE